MSAPRENVIVFPARDARGMTWQVRGIDNGARAAARALSDTATPAAALAEAALAQMRFADDAAQLASLLTRLSGEFETLRTCGRALTS